MDISMSEVAERGWVVRLGRCAVPFPSRQAAGQFVERLQQRLSAPHPLPSARSTACRDGHMADMQEVEHST